MHSYNKKLGIHTMGTWSIPLFASVSNGKPEDYQIDISSWSKEDIHKWHHSAFLGIEDKTIYNLKEFMNTECDTHKLMDHMSNGPISMWLKLFKYLYEKYPALNQAYFHFFCSDTQEPYYFTVFRHAPDHLYMAIGQSESCLYMVKTSFWRYIFRHDIERKYLKFSIEKYKKFWSVARFREIRLRINPNALWD